MGNGHGLLIAGKFHPIDGLDIIPPASAGGPGWARLGTDDYRQRGPGDWVRQIVIHTTGGHWPQPIIAGHGPKGHAQQIADMWNGADHGGGQRVHSAAQIVVDFDGSIAGMCDIAYDSAYHAEASNPWSIGIEMSTTPNGSIYQATIDATAILVATLCLSGRAGAGLFPIPFAMPRGPYRGGPIRRMETGASSSGNRHQIGGPDVCGVIGHRDNTSERGRGDPGDAIWSALAALGCEGLDYDGEEDLHLGRVRQQALNQHGEHLATDGVLGPASAAALLRQGFKRWCDVV